MKAVVAAFNQEKALVWAFSVITNFRMEIFGALIDTVVNTLYYDTAPSLIDPQQTAATFYIRLAVYVIIIILMSKLRDHTA